MSTPQAKIDTLTDAVDRLASGLGAAQAAAVAAEKRADELERTTRHRIGVMRAFIAVAVAGGLLVVAALWWTLTDRTNERNRQDRQLCAFVYNTFDHYTASLVAANPPQTPEEAAALDARAKAFIGDFHRRLAEDYELIDCEAFR